MTESRSIDSLVLSHFSNEAALVMRSVEQSWLHGRPSEYEKPKGLWVSVDGEQDWPAWCAAESFGIKPFRHRIVLAPGADILHCNEASDVLCFTERYGIEISSNSWRRVGIDWHRVAREYQGIIIAPYVWECRLEQSTSWYYGWDCASGCIWDAAAVARAESLAEAA